MKAFFAYIFAKSYFVCINVFREKEFPFAWGTAVVVFFVTLNIGVIVDLIEYFFFPNKFFPWNKYYGYFIGLVLIISWLFVYYFKLDKRILRYYKNIPDKKKRVLRLTSLLYYAISILSYFYVAELIRSIRLH